MSDQTLTWRETRARLAADRKRLTALVADALGQTPRWIVLHPGYLCVMLYRVSHYLHGKRRRLLARFVWHLNTLLTAADISPPCRIGEGLVILHPAGIAVSGNAGRNLTIVGLTGLGSEFGRRDDVGAGPGLPVLGDDVVLETNTGVLGPVRIGNRVRVRSGCTAVRDVGDDMIVSGLEMRVFSSGTLI